jgi:hypothetical protein
MIYTLKFTTIKVIATNNLNLTLVFEARNII